MYYVYILRCEGNSLYTGITRDVERRFREHCEGLGAKYTRSHKPLGVEAVWEIEEKGSALKLECHIKKLKREVKEKLIERREAEFLLPEGENVVIFRRIL